MIRDKGEIENLEIFRFGKYQVSVSGTERYIIKYVCIGSECTLLYNDMCRYGIYVCVFIIQTIIIDGVTKLKFYVF